MQVGVKRKCRSANLGTYVAIPNACKVVYSDITPAEIVLAGTRVWGCCFWAESDQLLGAHGNRRLHVERRADAAEARENLLVNDKDQLQEILEQHVKKILLTGH
jgi:hypothetical protein